MDGNRAIFVALFLLNAEGGVGTMTDARRKQIEKAAEDSAENCGEYSVAKE